MHDAPPAYESVCGSTASSDTIVYRRRNGKVRELPYSMVRYNGTGEPEPFMKLLDLMLFAAEHPSLGGSRGRRVEALKTMARQFFGDAGTRATMMACKKDVLRLHDTHMVKQVLVPFYMVYG